MSALAEFMERHARVALQFSAGKDSAACLKLLRPWIGKVVVIWGNGGRPYKQTREYMERIRASVPEFIEAQGTQPPYIAVHGFPADSVPFRATPLGRAASRGGWPLLSPVAECCSANLWRPLAEATQASGATGLIRGEKDADELRSTLRSGYTLMGMETFLPLEHWTDAQVFAYLGLTDTPPSYQRHAASLDCVTCTAYLGHDPGRFAALRDEEPEAFAEVAPVLAWMRDEARKNLAHLEAAL